MTFNEWKDSKMKMSISEEYLESIGCPAEEINRIQHEEYKKELENLK